MSETDNRKKEHQGSLAASSDRREERAFLFSEARALNGAADSAFGSGAGNAGAARWKQIRSDACMRAEDFPYHRTAALVDCAALAENLQKIREKLPEGMKLCAVVKADAYGHGIAGLLPVFERYADHYAVACTEEGEFLRSLGTEKPILLLGDAHRGEYARILSAALTTAISSADEAEALSALACSMGKTAHMHIAIDTGMSRIGFPADETGLLALRRIFALPGISVDGAFTHFATADEADKTRTYEQLRHFSAFTEAAAAEGMPLGVRHCANSAAVLDGIGMHFEMARAGIMMYGLYPSEEVAKSVPLVPVLQFKSYLGFVKELRAGAQIGYGGTYTLKKPMRIGTVTCGYADGYPWTVGTNGTEVLVHGKRCPVLGRVCMDQFMIGLDEVPEAKKGDLVTLFGRDGDAFLSAEEVAGKNDTCNYALVCGLTKRVPRVYLP